MRAVTVKNQDPDGELPELAFDQVAKATEILHRVEYSRAMIALRSLGERLRTLSVEEIEHVLDEVRANDGG